jgi:ABC-type branched-subunit amino acid transport system substrate-binding protein
MASPSFPFQSRAYKWAITRRGLLGLALALGGVRAGRRVQPLRLALLVPLPLGQSPGRAGAHEVAGQMTAWGALLAQETLAEVAERGGLDLQLLVVSTPNQEVLERAVQRLVALEEVVVLLGGIGQGQAEALGRLASQLGVLFVNLGDASPPLRKGSPLALHVEAELGSYLLGLRALTRRLGVQRPFLLGRQPDLRVWAQGVWPGAGGAWLAGSEDPLYESALAEAQGEGWDALILLLGPEEQLVALATAQQRGYSRPVLGLPTMAAQTRVFYVLARDVAPALAQYRLALWDPALHRGGARELNTRFLGRFGRLMDPPAWAGYVGVAAVLEGALAVGNTDPKRIRDALIRRGLDLAKGRPLAFDAGGQLEAALYPLKINQGATRPEDIVLLLDEEPIPLDGEGSP